MKESVTKRKVYHVSYKELCEKLGISEKIDVIAIDDARGFVIIRVVDEIL